jgi:hypothetical protein
MAGGCGWNDFVLTSSTGPSCSPVRATLAVFGCLVTLLHFNQATFHSPSISVASCFNHPEVLEFKGLVLC